MDFRHANKSETRGNARNPPDSGRSGRFEDGAARACLPLTKRADLEHLAVIAGFARDDELPAAIVTGHHRHHGDDGLAAGLCERRADARLLAELDQVARGGEWQLEPA